MQNVIFESSFLFNFATLETRNELDRVNFRKDIWVEWTFAMTSGTVTEDREENRDHVIYVSGKLPTYPSLKPTFCPKREVSVNVGLGEGLMGTARDPFSSLIHESSQVNVRAIKGG